MSYCTEQLRTKLVELLSATTKSEALVRASKYLGHSQFVPSESDINIYLYFSDMYTSTCEYVHKSTGYHGSQKKTSDPLELMSQKVVSCWT